MNIVFKAKHTFWSLFRKTRPENGAKHTAHFVGRILLLMLQKELRRSRWDVSCAAWGKGEQYEKCYKNYKLVQHAFQEWHSLGCYEACNYGTETNFFIS